MPEPGRRVIAEERNGNGDALPWKNARAFCHRVIETGLADFRQTDRSLVIFDRSALDALIWFDRTNTPLDENIRQAILDLQYDRLVYLVPPWPEIFEQDQDRRHDLSEAIAEYGALCDRLPVYGFQPVIVPKKPIPARADWLEAQLQKG